MTGIRCATEADYAEATHDSSMRFCEDPECELIGPIEEMVQLGESWYCPDHAEGGDSDELAHRMDQARDIK